MIERIARKKQSILSRKKLYFCILLTVFFLLFSPFLCPRAILSRRSSLIGSSFYKSDRERFAQVAHDKRAMGAIRLVRSWQKSKGSDRMNAVTKLYFLVGIWQHLHSVYVILSFWWN